MLNCINDYNGDSTKYFSWGDIIGQNKNDSGSYSFSQANYNAGACGSGHNLSSDIPQGDARYDASRANMGSPWKMPTKEQCQELKDGTNPTWTTMNGVNGYKLTSKTDSSKYIFLPAGGFWIDTNHFSANDRCYYLTTTWLKINMAISLAFSTSTMPEVSSTYTWYGDSVRAKEKAQVLTNPGFNEL